MLLVRRIMVTPSIEVGYNRDDNSSGGGSRGYGNNWVRDGVGVVV